MGADQDVHLAAAELLQHALDVRGGTEPGDRLDPHREVAEALAEGRTVLLGEHRCRHQREHLTAAGDALHGGAHRHLGLAEADVAADQAVHRPVGLHVLGDGVDRALLVVGLLVGERLLQPRRPLVVARERRPQRGLAARVQRQQLAGQLAHRHPRPRLEVVPRLAAQLGEGRRRAVRADVAADLAELLVRHVEPVVAAELQVEVVAHHARDLLGVEADEAADAVVVVHHVVARPQVAERDQRPPAADAAARRPAPEQLRGRDHRQPQPWDDDAVSQAGDGRRRRPASCGTLAAGRRSLDVDPGQRHPHPRRLADVREADQHPIAGADQRPQLVLGLGDAERGQRGRLGLERVRLAEWHRLQRAAALDQRVDLVRRT